MAGYGEATELLAEVMGTKHSWCRDAYFGVAEVFHEQGEADSARAYAKEALEIDEALRESSYHLVEDYRLLARIESRNDLSESEHLIETAIAHGAPKYNSGDAKGCAEIYTTAAKELSSPCIIP